LSSSFQDVLRRVGVDRAAATLRYRAQSELPFINTAEPTKPKLLFDTTVYIDTLQMKYPAETAGWTDQCEQWHSPVTEAELAYSCGRLNPHHPGTAAIVSKITESIGKRPVQRILYPDRETWQEAAVLCGVLARLQQHEKSGTSRLLNDALIFSTAQKHDCTVLTRNLRDFDLMLQIVPAGRVLFYQCS